MVADVFEDAGYAGNSKKKAKKGFKSDRRANFEKKLSNAGKGPLKSQKPARTQPIKEVKFDDAARREFLLTMHKKKNERRVSAFVDSKRKMKRENTKFRMQQREEARLAYNSYAQVPILPDFSYRIRTAAEGGEEEDGAKTAAHSATGGDVDTTVFCGGNGCDDVTVTVEPLFKNRSDQARRTLPSNDFSDLPDSVAKELAKIKKERKGPSKTKAKVHQLKELEKIRKIRKHTRKGHGKSGAKGKKRNR